MMRTVIGNLVESVFPTRCPACNRICGPTETGFCDGCEQGLWPIVRPWCRRCGRPMFGEASRERICGQCVVDPPRYESLLAGFHYGGPLADAIIRFKHGHRASHARRLAGLLAGQLEGEPLSVDCLVPVPMHWRRLQGRGYNQAELLARVLAKRWGLQVSGNLRRVTDTGTQRGRTREARRAAMEGAFAVRRCGQLAGLRVGLVDDVMTTGATLAMCTEALLAAGAASVTGLILARVD